MNLKSMVLSALIISANTITLNAMDRHQQEQFLDICANTAKVALDLNNISYQFAQTVNPTTHSEFNKLNSEIQTSLAKSLVDIDTLNKKIDLEIQRQPGNLNLKIIKSSQNLMLMAMFVTTYSMSICIDYKV